MTNVLALQTLPTGDALVDGCSSSNVSCVSNASCYSRRSKSVSDSD